MSWKFNPFTSNFDQTGTGASSLYWLDPVDTQLDLPLTDLNGASRNVKATDTVHIFDGSTSKWINSGLTVAAFSATANAAGITVDSATVGNITSQTISLHKADATNPGGVSTDAQTFGGVKTLNDGIKTNGIQVKASTDVLSIGTDTNASQITLGVSGTPVVVPDKVVTNTIDVTGTGGTDTLSIGATNADVINIGRTGATVNLLGTVNDVQATNVFVDDKLITVNHGGPVTTGGASGLEIEEDSVITGYAKTSVDRNSWELKAPNTAGIATVTPGASGITLNQSSHDPVTITDTNSIDLSLSTQVLSADIKISSNAADASNTKVSLNVEGTSSLGLRAQVLNSDIQSLISVTDTNSIDFGYSSGAVTGDVKISSNAADASNTKVNLNIESTSSLGIRAQIPNAGSGQNGALTSTDWNTFNGKLTPNTPITGATKTKITYDANGLVTAGADANLDDLGDVLVPSPAVNDLLTWNGTNWVNTTPIVGQGNGVTFFYNDVASDIGGYFDINTSPVSAAEVDDSVAVTSGTSPVLIESYASPVAGLGDSQIDAGVWIFNTWASVSSTATGLCTVRFDVYKRTSGGVETLLFTVNTPTLTTSIALYDVETVQPSFAINPTDRLVIKVSATNTVATSRTVHFYHNGTTHYSHVHTPLIQRHNDLAGLQGGSSTERYHLTSSQATVATQAATGSLNGYLSSTDWTTFNNKVSKVNGDIVPTTFAITNNQSTPANVTGFSFSNGTVFGFDALVVVYIVADTSKYEVYKLLGIQKTGGWDMSYITTGDSSGVVFTITSVGQIQYTSPNSSGFSSGAIKFRATTIPTS